MKRNNNLLSLTILFLVVCISSTNLHAQLVGWQYKDAVRIQENSGLQKINYQVLLTINTAPLVLSGKMLASGDDIRFAKNCNGSILYNYWIESGMNTANTKIWVLIDTIAASGTRIMNMFYGNSAAVAASNFMTTFPNQKIISAAEPVTDTIWNFDWVEIQAGAVATLSQATFPNRLTINARKIKIAGTLDGNGAGFGGALTGIGSGPGGGTGGTSYGGGGGGAYGGNGGNGGVCSGCGSAGPGGIAYGNNSDFVIQAGSGGGAGATATGFNKGGNGGAIFILSGTDIEISGTITVNGTDGIPSGFGGAGGGGAGGGILCKGYNLNVTGTLTAVGGQGPTINHGGGGGGGGRIKFFNQNLYVNTSTTNVAGGPATQTEGCTPGANGTFYNGTYVSGVPTVTILSHVILTESANPICQGAAVTFTATTPFSNYNFYVNATSVQSGSSNTYTSTTINNNNNVKVLASYAGACIDTSNVITMTVTPAPNVNLGPDSIICTTAQLTLDAGNFPGYVWQDNSTASTFVVDGAALGIGIYTFYVDVMDAIGCSGSDTIDVTVTDCTGLVENGEVHVSISPNPAEGILNISIANSSGGVLVFEIMNVAGQVVAGKKIDTPASEYTSHLDISTLARGLYYLNIDNGKNISVHKIVVQ